MELTIENIEFLLLIAALVAMFAQRVRIPYTVGLVLAGIALSFFPFGPRLELSKELIFTVLLPPLIFEATLFIRWRELIYNLPIILLFATIGVVFSAILTIAGMVYLAGWAWQSAVLFGILIAATDPVSVIATFKEAGVHGRLRLLVEAESLFNDATAAVGFAVALAIVTGNNISVQTTFLNTAYSIFGGLIIGALCAAVILLLTHTTDDHLVELTLSTVAAYGSFLIAEDLHVSGVLSTLTAGILVGNFGLPYAYSDKGRAFIMDFWEFMAFIANSIIFFLIGVSQANQISLSTLLPVTVAILVVTLGRAAAIYPLSALFDKSRLKIDRNHQHILFWGGLRGALALALALGLPPELEYREQIITAAFGVVAFSIFVQGVTMTPLLRGLKVLSSVSAPTQPVENVETGSEK
ncbi:MAG: sodium:proton antiporter [Anaerolineae bacterium]|nr:sodium:proton antiporter [Anaerolineae bacterium]MCI0609016.1 sodium:proton antiporter [Anaerolineae bacterium]